MRLFSVAAGLALAALLSSSPGHAAQFRLTSPDLTPGGTIADRFVFNGFGCTGGNVSPALAWSGAPAGTKSFVVTAYDPDAPSGSGWWHWVVADIPAGVTALPQGAGAVSGQGLPAGAVQGRTDYGSSAYGGPCPPQGDKPHRYIFTVHALSVDRLPADPQASAAMVGFALHGSEIGRASLTTRYGR
ncbi:YbhB/YbcL family Raf kinase inhibitor-like protein [Inquilinus limosus]|uniref:Phosphatidylethanolamine-binding protein n=1 Tax=Inquilinus limosus TaxID=171674 RepID=A0A211ZPX4_9PROT|nr:YbhB/YbcL family Raf kinase inhibitor-like protein [Inquilinus limosus]OWJ67333.1 phosphatidylethanolamine-binding protein [Inquilinus limosus]